VNDDLDLDLDHLDDVGDPLAGAAVRPPPPFRSKPSARPWTRAQKARLRWAALGVAVLSQAAWVGIMNERADLHSMPRATLMLEVALPLAAAGLALAAAIAPGANGLGLPKRRLATLTILAPLGFALLTLLSAPMDGDTESFALHGLRCFTLTAVFSIVPLGLVAWAFRHAFVAAAPWRVAGLGIASAGLAAATMSTMCSVGSAGHVLVSHGGMMLVAGIGGALVGRRIAQA
jgi:hypothetical protein